MLCMILIPAAPPRSIQKTIMSVGAKIGGIGEVDFASSGTACWVSDMKELPFKTAPPSNFGQLPTHAGRHRLLPALFLAKGVFSALLPAGENAFDLLLVPRLIGNLVFQAHLEADVPEGSAWRSRSS